MKKQVLTVIILLPLLASLVSLHQIDKNDTKQTISILAEWVSEANIKRTIEDLSAFKNRRWDTQSGVDAAFYVADRIKQCAGSRKDVSVSLFIHPKDKHPSWTQPSVIAHLEGTSHPEEIVIVGSHLDSINHTKVVGGTKDDIAPGADDNASGTATNLEAFCLILRSGLKPAKSIEYMAVAAEEVGLWGSMDIAETYRAQNKKVVAMLQLDMVLFPSRDGSIVFISDFVDAKLTKQTQQLAKDLGYSVSNDPCKYQCSDHASWNKFGYPSVFPFEAYMNEDNQHIHSADDTIENAGGTFEAPKFAKLSIAFMLHFAN